MVHTALKIIHYECETQLSHTWATSRRDNYRIWSIECDYNPCNTARDLLYIYRKEMHSFTAKLVTQTIQSVCDSLDDNSQESLLSLLSPGSFKSHESPSLPDEESLELDRCCFSEGPFLTLILLMRRIWWAANNAGKWQMGFNSAFKGLMSAHHHHHHDHRNRSRRSCPLLPSLTLLPAGSSLSAALVTDPSRTFHYPLVLLLHVV